MQTRNAPTSSLPTHGYAWQNGPRSRIIEAEDTVEGTWRQPARCLLRRPCGPKLLARQYGAPGAQHNQGTWRVSVEDATKKYAGRATGDVYVITGPVFEPSIAQSKAIGPGQVRVPKYLFKLVYDEQENRAWAHWHLNDDATRASRPISYGELVKRTGIEFLPGLHLAQ